jgi:hypothetical protein
MQEGMKKAFEFSCIPGFLIIRNAGRHEKGI